MCEYITASGGWKCSRPYKHGVRVFGRDQEVKYFCSAHFSTVIWTLKQTGQHFEIVR